MAAAWNPIHEFFHICGQTGTFFKASLLTHLCSSARTSGSWSGCFATLGLMLVTSHSLALVLRQANHLSQRKQGWPWYSYCCCLYQITTNLVTSNNTISPSSAGQKSEVDLSAGRHMFLLEALEENLVFAFSSF